METVLIATDFSPAAKNALIYGADLAKFFSSKIVILHAFSLPVGGYDSMAPLNVIGEMQTSALEGLKENKKTIIERIGYDPGIEILAEIGSVFTVVEDVANKCGAELVVMGMVGEAGKLKRSLIGSNSLKAARNLEVPLLVVPENVSYSRISKISFACDLEHLEELSVIHITRSFCSMFNAQLEIVNVRPKEGETVSSVIAQSVIDKKMKNIAHKVVTISNDKPSVALEEYFRTHKTDLVILNPKKHNLFERLFSKSTTEDLIFDLKVPMLIIRSN